jgi:hypothetical protein
LTAHQRELQTDDKSLLMLTRFVVNAGLQQDPRIADIVAEDLWGAPCTVDGW